MQPFFQLLMRDGYQRDNVDGDGLNSYMLLSNIDHLKYLI